MFDFFHKYPNDPNTQIKLLDELDACLFSLDPQRVFSKRFIFLLKYFKVHGDEQTKKMCTSFLHDITGE